jgi:hypothetical protein
MANANNSEWGNRRDFPYQNNMLLALGEIIKNTAVLSPDYETRTTRYQAIANGVGYVIGQFISRYDIINVVTQVVTATIWFNETTQAVIAAPVPADLTPVASPTSVTVNNGAGGAAVNIQDGGNSITVDNANLDVALSTLLSKVDFEARINTHGQKTMATSTPVVLASDQSAIPVTLPVGVSRVPSVVNVPASSAASTTAGVKELSILVIGSGNTVGGVSIPSGTILSYVAPSGDTVGALAYTTGGGANRLILTYLT